MRPSNKGVDLVLGVVGVGRDADQAGDLVVVEVDGGQHAESRRDAVRDAYLRDQGYRVLRFWNNEVLGNISGVLEVIARELAART